MNKRRWEVQLPACQKAARPATIKETLAPSVDILAFHSLWDYRVSKWFSGTCFPLPELWILQLAWNTVFHLFSVHVTTGLGEHFFYLVSTKPYQKTWTVTAVWRTNFSSFSSSTWELCATRWFYRLSLSKLHQPYTRQQDKKNVKKEFK